MQFIRPTYKTIYDINDPDGIKYLSRLRLGLSHLNDHKFRHNFHDCLYPLCSCSLDVEDNEHFFLRCHHYLANREILFSKVRKICTNFDKMSANFKIEVLLYGDSKLQYNENQSILRATIDYIVTSSRFSGSLMKC